MPARSVPERGACVEYRLVLLVPPLVTAAPTEEVAEPDLTALVQNARRGLRRDVAALEAALDDTELLVPLAHAVPDAPEGEAMPLDRPIEIQPHFIVDEE